MQTLRQRLDAFRKATGAQMPSSNPDFDPDDEQAKAFYDQHYKNLKNGRGALPPTG